MKKVMLGVLVSVVSVLAHADAMYWQISSMDGQTSGFDVDSDSWSYAQIEVLNLDGSKVGDGTYLKIAGTDTDLLAKNAGGAWFDFGAYSGTSPEYAFMLELVDESYDVMAASTKMSYSDIASQGVIVPAFDAVSPLSYVSWNAGTVELPEPTSGLLMLLGASLLALRRRQA